MNLFTVDSRLRWLLRRGAMLVGACAWMLLTGNSATDAIGTIRFEEIGAKAGVRHLHHTRKFSGKSADVLGMFTSGGSAVAVGDYDNDGFDDLFVTDSDTGQPNRLYRNNGDGTFADVTDPAGVAGGNDPLSIGEFIFN